MKLTIKNKLIICWEVLTKSSGHKHLATSKDISIFQAGYDAGFKDCSIELESIAKTDKPYTDQPNNARVNW